MRILECFENLLIATAGQTKTVNGGDRAATQKNVVPAFKEMIAKPKVNSKRAKIFEDEAGTLEQQPWHYFLRTQKANERRIPAEVGLPTKVFPLDAQGTRAGGADDRRAFVTPFSAHFNGTANAVFSGLVTP